MNQPKLMHYDRAFSAVSLFQGKMSCYCNSLMENRLNLGTSELYYQKCLWPEKEKLSIVLLISYWESFLTQWYPKVCLGWLRHCAQGSSEHGHVLEQPCPPQYHSIPCFPKLAAACGLPWGNEPWSTETEKPRPRSQWWLNWAMFLSEHLSWLVPTTRVQRLENEGSWALLGFCCRCLS